MIRLEAGGADAFRVVADKPVKDLLAKTFQQEAFKYPCLWMERNEEENVFLHHIQYLPAVMELLQSSAVTEKNQRSKNPTRTMTKELQYEIEHWEMRRENIIEAKNTVLPPPEWNPLGNLEIPLKLPLRPFQRSGVAWMVFSENGILADPTGTGKSCQSLAYCAALMKAGLAKNALILSPKAVVLQWAKEGIMKFLPNDLCDYQIVDGEGYRNRHGQWRSGARFTLTNYEKVRIDHDKISDLAWDILILDESQMLRGRRSLVSQRVKNIRKKYCFALTATPIETVLEDLFSLMEIVHPCILGNYAAFRQIYILENRRNPFQRYGYRISEIKKQLPERIAFAKLRREKAVVLPQLPPVQECTVPVVMEPDQEALYRSMEEEAGEAMDLLDRRLGKTDYLPIITKILRLQQIANAPAQFDPSLDYPAGKILALQELLETMNGKVLLFSFFKTMIDLLYQEVTAWIASGQSSFEQVLWMTGDRSDPQEREAIKEEFNHSPQRTLLLSTDCFKHGVNLQAAEAVICYDTSYNPGTMLQRIGRAHRDGMDTVNRIGATDHVLVYSLVTQQTLEERIPLILAARRSLAEESLADSDGALLPKFTRQELGRLLGRAP